MAFWQTSMAESFSSVLLGDFKAQDQCSVNTGHSVYVEQMPQYLDLSSEGSSHSKCCGEKVT